MSTRPTFTETGDHTPLPAERNELDDDPQPQRLPNELMARVMDQLQEKQQLATLAKVARVSKALRELAIPKLYRIVHVTRQNVQRLFESWERGTMLEGHNGGSQEDADSSLGMAGLALLQRNSGAMVHCRHVIFDPDPDSDVIIKMVHEIVRAQATAHRECVSAVAFLFLLSPTPGVMEELGRSAYRHQALEHDSHWLPGSNPTTLHMSRHSSYHVMDSITRLANYPPSNRGLDIIVRGMPLNVMRAGGLDFSRIRSNTTLTVYFDLTTLGNYNYNGRSANLARWLLMFFDTPTSDAGSYKLNLYDIPSLILAKDDLPKDRGEATTLARARLSEQLKAQSDEGDDWKGGLGADNAQGVCLLDNPEGHEIKWPEPRGNFFDFGSWSNQTEFDYVSSYSDYDSDHDGRYYSDSYRYLDDNDSESEYW